MISASCGLQIFKPAESSTVWSAVVDLQVPPRLVRLPAKFGGCIHPPNFAGNMPRAICLTLTHMTYMSWHVGVRRDPKAVESKMTLPLGCGGLFEPKTRLSRRWVTGMSR